jgi:APA family basic amino acid/polyamine antiporter
VARRRRQAHELERVLGANALFATAYGNVGSSIYYALGLTAGIALGLTPLVFIISGIIFAATAATYAEGTVHYPEAGGSSSFARHAFNELVSFGAAWAQMLNYVITVAISVIFVPHYLAVFWGPLRTTPWDVIIGIAFTWLLVGLNVVGIQEAAKLNIVLAVLDFATQLILVALGFFLIFSPHILAANIHFGQAPTWANFALAIPVAMIAYTGIETVSNLAEEARDPLRSIPKAISWVAIAVFAIYFTLPWIALSAMPVVKVGTHYVTQLGQNPPHGFKNDPVLGLVRNLGLHGALLQVAKIYVGILAATILFIATNAGVIGASRITYSMAAYRQLPSIFRRLHRKFRTPWLSLVVFAGLAPTIFLLSGQVDFLGRMYAFGAMLELPIQRCQLAALRDRRRARHRAGLARGRRAGRALALRRAGVADRRLHLLRALSPPPQRATPGNGAGAGRDHGRRARVPQHPRAGRARIPVGRGDGHRLPAFARARLPHRGDDGDRGPARPAPRRVPPRAGEDGERAARRSACDR